MAKKKTEEFKIVNSVLVIDVEDSDTWDTFPTVKEAVEWALDSADIRIEDIDDNFLFFTVKDGEIKRIQNLEVTPSEIIVKYTI